MSRKYLLVCGVLAPLVYVGAVIIGGLLRPGYSHVAHVISELIAAGAPNTTLLIPLFTLYDLLLAAFGAGLLLTVMARSEQNGTRSGAWGALALIVAGLLGVLMNLFFPQDPGGPPVTFAGTVHVVLAGVLSLGTMLAMLCTGLWLRNVPGLRPVHSIAAPPAVVWQWLIQAGYRGAGRAGWYSDSGFDWLAEKLFFRLTVPSQHRNAQPMLHSANELLPAFQRTAVGDIVPDGPNSSPFFVVKAVQPERAWVLYSDTHLRYLSPTLLHKTPLASSGEFTWVFVLNPQGEQGTRLILRTRTRYGPPLMRYLALPLLYGGEAIFPRLILRGIRQRAEQQVSSLREQAAS